MGVMVRSSSYTRIPSQGQLAGSGAPPHTCRGRAARIARGSLPLLLACLISSVITYGAMHGLQQRAAAAAQLDDRLDALVGPGGAAARAAQRLPGAPRLPVRPGDPEALRIAAAARLLDKELGRQQQQQQQQEQAPQKAVAGHPNAHPAAAGVQQQQKGTAAAIAAPAAAAAAAKPAVAAKPQADAAASQHAASAHAAASAAKPRQQQRAPLPLPVAQPAAAAAAHTKDPGARAPALSQAASAPAPHAPHPGAAQRRDGTLSRPFGSSGRMTVALVNHAPYHLEIVAGWLHVLRRLGAEVIWYQSGQKSPDGNFTPEELLETQGFHDLVASEEYRMVPADSPPVRVDFAVFVSPEYYEAETKAFLDKALPISSVMVAHNGRNHALQRLKALAPRTHIVTLAPHVAAAAKDGLQIDADWAMPTFPFQPKEPCSLSSINAISCLHGFSIQGNFEPQRRNYTRMWEMLRTHAAKGEVPTRPPLPPLHLHLVGRGNVEQLQLPEAVKPMTTVHFNQRYPDYYEQIHHTHALLLVLGSPTYLDAKMSSSVVTSLTTGTPVVADAATLKAYALLPKDAAFPMAPGEDEVDAMLRVLRLSPADVFAAHRRVREAAEALNARTLELVTARWAPKPREVAARHAALGQPYTAAAAAAVPA